MVFEPSAVDAGLDDIAMMRDAVERGCAHLGIHPHLGVRAGFGAGRGRPIKETGTMTDDLAPEWATDQWFNSPPLTLAALRGRVVVLGTFQMLCPGCVSDGLPQLQRVEQTFAREDVVVVALHTVFEHHAAMTPVSLEAFLHEYRIAFAVGVDAHDEDGRLPLTMQRYNLRGTPSLVLIDRQGRLRHSAFGHEPDLALGARIAMLLAEGAGMVAGNGQQPDGDTCAVGGDCD